MVERSTSTRGDGSAGKPEGPEAAELRAEVTRLRGLLVEQDVEMGKLRGRLQQLEERTTRMLGLFARLRRFGPAFARLRRLGRNTD